MTGGPGCSSELALFAENGPYRVNDDLTLAVNEHGWDTVANLIYVDQPIGTGFSYSTDPADDVHDERRVAEDMLQFLSEFSDAHPELKGRDFFVTGESYAGHYVPAVSYRVFREQQKGGGPSFSLRGLAIGNGLTMPEIQYGAYADYALGVDLVASEDGAEARDWPSTARANDPRVWRTADPDGPGRVGSGGLVCARPRWRFARRIPSSLLEAAGDVNVYDAAQAVRGARAVLRLHARGEVLELAGHARRAGRGRARVGGVLANKVHADMMADWMRNLELVIPPMLEGGLARPGVRGRRRFHLQLAREPSLRAMEWSGREDFVAARAKPFVVDGATGGDVIEIGSAELPEDVRERTHGADGPARERAGDAPAVHRRRAHRGRDLEPRVLRERSRGGWPTRHLLLSGDGATTRRRDEVGVDRIFRENSHRRRDEYALSTAGVTLPQSHLISPGASRRRRRPRRHPHPPRPPQPCRAPPERAL